LKRFLKHTLLFLSPFVFVIISFLIFDPFKIIYDYGELMFVEHGTLDGFTLNRDVVGTEMFLKKKDSLQYDSFIFGSSRASVFRSKHWANHIDNKAIPFHFIGSGESLFGIWSKLKFLEKLDYPVKNALFIIDFELLQKVKNGKGVIALRHPATAGDYFNFYLIHLKEYVSTDFFIQYLDFKFFKKKRRYMDKLFDNDTRGLVFDNYKNDWIHQGKATAIAQDSIKYYKEKPNVFYDRPVVATTAPKVIESKQRKMLADIARILKQKKAAFRIVINPLYNQKEIESQDLQVLTDLFGSQNVFNFSGKNAITDYKGNYYENSHFKPFIASQILQQIY